MHLRDSTKLVDLIIHDIIENMHDSDDIDHVEDIPHINFFYGLLQFFKNYL